ncbi:MAG: SDR family NAD(P)-dependent oxidoreductase [Pseudonocardiaceae bacterium]
MSQDVTLIRHTFAVNVMGVVCGCHAVLPAMLGNGSGHILNLASAAAVKPIAGLAAYSASKAAVLALGESLRRECRGTGVHISTVLPYLTCTAAGSGLLPQPGFRPVTPNEVADAVLKLLRRPRPTAFVPHRLGPLLATLAVLPHPLRDVVDTLFASDQIALSADQQAREDYHHQLQQHLPADPRASPPGPSRRCARPAPTPGIPPAREGPRSPPRTPSNVLTKPKNPKHTGTPPLEATLGPWGCHQPSTPPKKIINLG